MRRFRIPRLTMPWQVPAIAWICGGVLAALGAAFAEDCRISLAAAGLFTIALLRRVTRQMSAHQSRHRRLDRQVGAATSVLRKGYHDEGLSAFIPQALEDDRAQRPDGASVTELRPRVTPAHRQPRSRRLRP